jgi:hypothetical protein
MAASLFVCAADAVNSPDNWFNCIGLDGRLYTAPEMAFFFVGCALWVVAYLIMMIRAWKTKFFEMAAFAGACNFGWEIVWGLFQRTDMGLALQICYQAWLALDLVLFGMLFVWGHKQIDHPWIRKHFKVLIVATAAFWALFFQTYALQGLDTTIGANSAYICQVILSACCFLLITRMPNIAGFSLWAGNLRCIGTALVTVFMFLHYPDHPFLLLLAATSTLIDAGYMWVLWRRWLNGDHKGVPGIPDSAVPPVPKF